MQLLIILALLLYGGKSGAKNLIEEVKPVLESIGGEDMKQALKSAEEITEVLSAVQELTKQPDGEQSRERGEKQPTGFAGEDCGAASRVAEAAPQNDGANERETRAQTFSFPLAPISEIADRDITYSLSRYLSQN